MTAFLLVVARLGFAAVLATAGFAKLLDRRGTRKATATFGAPAALVPSLALVIPLAELAAVGLLLPAATAKAGAAVGLGLLAVFSTAIALNLARGRAPECHCFGQLHSAPAGPATLIRNAVLGAVAVFVLADGGGPSAVAWVGRLHGAGLVAVVGGVAIATLASGFALAFASLLRSYGRVLVRVDRLEQSLRDAGVEVEDSARLEVLAPRHGIAPGTAAPTFALSDVTGDLVSLDDLLAARLPLMLVFASSECAPCSALMPALANWQDEHDDRITVAIAIEGPPADVRSEAEELALDHVLLDEASQLYDAFEANGTPSAVLIAADGTIASYVAAGASAIEALLRTVLDAPGLPLGAPAPSLELESLGGERIQLPGSLGMETLLLFWNPDCGFCRAIHDQLLDWEQVRNGDTPRLVVVSSGEAEPTRAEGFRSTVVLDPDFSAGDLLGAAGTPSAVIVGADGRIASNIAVGGPAVLELAGAQSTVSR